MADWSLYGLRVRAYVWAVRLSVEDELSIWGLETCKASYRRYAGWNPRVGGGRRRRYLRHGSHLLSQGKKKTEMAGRMEGLAGVGKLPLPRYCTGKVDCPGGWWRSVLVGTR